MTLNDPKFDLRYSLDTLNVFKFSSEVRMFLFLLFRGKRFRVDFMELSSLKALLKVPMIDATASL